MAVTVVSGAYQLQKTRFIGYATDSDSHSYENAEFALWIQCWVLGQGEKY
jgi:hypothetical protein